MQASGLETVDCLQFISV